MSNIKSGHEEKARRKREAINKLNAANVRVELEKLRAWLVSCVENIEKTREESHVELRLVSAASVSRRRLARQQVPQRVSPRIQAKVICDL